MAEIKITVRGKAADAIETIRRITGRREPVDVLVSALRIYEWILVQQVRGGVVVAEFPDKEKKEQELVNYVQDRDTAARFFA